MRNIFIFEKKVVILPLNNNTTWVNMNIKKQKLCLEYPLATKSPNIVWEQISTIHGLERWLADHVEEEDGAFVFTWGEPWTEQDIRHAQLIEYVKYDHIRLQWDEDAEEGEDVYWEMRIEKSELTGHLNLLITDFADDDDADGLKILWESNLDRLHRASGL